MRYSTEPKNKIYVKGCGFLPFAKNMVTRLSNKYSQKLLDTAKQSTIDAIKTASKRVIQKTVEATGDLVGNKITNKITKISKTSQFHNRIVQKQLQMRMIKKYLKKDINFQKKDRKLLMIY